MKLHLPAVTAAAILTFCSLTQAQTTAPAGSTGQCNDGSYSQSAEKKGACRGHQGVKTWFGAESSPRSTASQSRSQPASASTRTNSPANSTMNRSSNSSASPSASGPPSGATGQCNDGTYSFSTEKKGACRGHQGVKSWSAAEPAPSQATAQTTAAQTQNSAPAAPRNPSSNQGATSNQSYTRSQNAPSSQNASSAPPQQNSSAFDNSTSPAKPRAATASTPMARAGGNPAPGGTSGQVWVNTKTNVYHCQGDRYYGKTKEGAYMDEGDAKAKGARPDAGKPCAR